MEANDQEQLNAHAGSIMALLQQNTPLLQNLEQQLDEFNERFEEFCKIRIPDLARTNPDPRLKELTRRQVHLWGEESIHQLYPKYCEFRLVWLTAMDIYEHVGEEMLQFRQPDGTFKPSSPVEIFKFRKLLQKDEKFADFPRVNVHQIAAQWETMDLLTKLNVWVQKMHAIKMKMEVKLQAMQSGES